MGDRSEMHSAQITRGPLKLSVEPLPIGPYIEFTDYETDISWLSGPLYVNATIREAPASQIALQNPIWKKKGEHTIEILGRLGDFAVTIDYSLLENPPRLEERISIGNPTDNEISFDRLRIGSVMSPPKSWWKYWAYWRLTLISPETDRERLSGVRLSSLIEDIRSQKGDDSVRADIKGAILTDDKRFLSITGDKGIHLKIIDSKPTPIIVAGGIVDAEVRQASTTYIPGTGGMEEAKCR